MKTINQRGGVTIFVAILLPVLLGLASLVIDVGYLLVMRNQMQASADAAALVGANALQHAETISDAKLAALEATRANGFENGKNSTSVTVSIPPGGSGSFALDARYVRVTLAKPTSTFLAWIVGVLKTSTTVQAVAGPATSAGPCLLTLGTAGAGALSVTGNAVLNDATCGIYVNSNNSSAITENGNASIISNSIQVVGNYSKNGNSTISPVTINANALADPFSGMTMPIFSSCDFNNFSISGNGAIILQPGIYCGGIKINGNHTVTLMPGMYQIYGGGLNIAGNISSFTGSGVTIYNSGNTSTYPFGSIDLSGNEVLNLSAPTSGAYTGMLIMQNTNNSLGASVAGNSAAVLAGNFYFPGNTLNLTGNSGTGIPMGAVVAKQVSIYGNANLSMSDVYMNNSGGAARAGLYQ